MQESRVTSIPFIFLQFQLGIGNPEPNFIELLKYKSSKAQQTYA